MKNLYKVVSLLAVTAVSLTGCIHETFPESSTATKDQISASASALEASVSGIPAQMCQGYLVYGDQVHETDMAFPQFLILMTEMMGDIYPEGSNSGYDWFRNYNTFSSTYGETSYMAYLPWRTLYMFIKSANDVLASIDYKNPEINDDLKGMAGVALVTRAMSYYYLTVLYEPVANIYTDCSKVLGLTVPIVTQDTPSDSIKCNPRAKHDDMIAFMENDLLTAIDLMENYVPESKYYPSLAAAWGHLAKVYMWDENYSDAAAAAAMAIETSGCTPLSEAEWLDVNNGFNNANSNNAWIWGAHYSAENMGNLCNFTGWMSAEADWGYSTLTLPSIDRSLYDKIAYTDFRKYTFLDPDRSVYDYQTVRDEEWFENSTVDYLSIKFRCLGGDWEDYAVGGACDVPIMRVEEMYLLQAEALGMLNLSDGVAALNSFMQTYRDASYVCHAANQRDFQIEVLLQERIEFWGEGTAVLPNAKRIKPGVIQYYEGTNAPADLFKINCEGIKPNWNLVISYLEVENNTALQGLNNPDPTKIVTITDCAPGQYAPAKF